jgi:hypothetical protein
VKGGGVLKFIPSLYSQAFLFLQPTASPCSSGFVCPSTASLSHKCRQQFNGKTGVMTLVMAVCYDAR